MNQYQRLYILLLFFILCLSSCKKTEQDVDWAEYLGGQDRNHYSILDEINAENVNLLEKVWEYNTGDKGEMQCNPLIIDRHLFSTTATNEVISLDATTGQFIWKFSASEDKSFLVNRGISFWKNGDDKRIFTAYGEWLYALDFYTGNKIATFGENGRVHLKSGMGENSKEKFVTSRTPGTVFDNLIIMPLVVSEGNGAAPGYIQAYNTVTGELEWVFHTIPRPGEYGYETWPENAYKSNSVGGGANSWSGMSLDEKNEILFIPTGSASPDFYGGERKGENLFANCIIALDVRTGKRIWHYQVVHHDIWDRDLPAPPNLFSVRKDGQEIPALAQITKSGHVFVLNRLTGEPIFPINEIQVPSSSIPGEEAWPTQPVPELPQPFSRQVITESEINPYSQDRDSLLAVFRQANKPAYTPLSEEPTFILPGSHGGAEWGGAAIDPEGIMYINSNEMACVFSLSKNTTTQSSNSMSFGERLYAINCESCHRPDRKGIPSSGYPSLINLQDRLSKEDVGTIVQRGKGMMPGFPQLTEREMVQLLGFLFSEEIEPSTHPVEKQANGPIQWKFNGYTRFKDKAGFPGISPPWGTLTAIDLNTGLHKWQIPIGEYPELKEKGIENTGTPNYGGPLVTKNGLIFLAATTDKKFRAIDKSSGQVIWETDLPYPGFATPSTYRIDGKQYIVIVCGGTKADAPKGDAIVAFALP